jgi:hypothetical protein
MHSKNLIYQHISYVISNDKRFAFRKIRSILLCSATKINRFRLPNSVMISYIYFFLDLFWNFFDVAYLYLDFFDIEILAKASELLFYQSPFLYPLIVIITFPKLIPPCKIVVLRVIKFIYVFWNAIEFFFQKD